MIATIIGYVRNLHLTLQEWAGIAVAAVIGALVTALRIQGSQLHKAQVKVLDLTRKPKEDAAAASVSAADKAYEDALSQFIKAGGKLALLLCLWPSVPSYAADSFPPAHYLSPTPTCEDVLLKCDALVRELKNDVSVLQESNKAWRKMAETNTEHNAAPVVVSSTVSGAVAGGIFGAAIGLGLGAVIGITVGIILDEVF